MGYIDEVSKKIPVWQQHKLEFEYFTKDDLNWHLKPVKSVSGNPTLPAWLGPFMFDMAFQTQAENDKIVRQMRSSAGIAVFVAAQSDRAHWVRAGQACQRFALQATALGMKHAFLNQPTEVSKLRPDLAALVGLPGRRPNLVMRFGYGPTRPMSPRRPVEAVLA